MRILLVINGTDFGGTETGLLRTATQLDARGHKTHVLSMKPLGAIGGLLQDVGVRVSSLGMSSDAGALSSLAAVRALAALLRSGEYDIVHSFLPRANILSRFAIGLAGRPIPHVSGERSTDFKRSDSVVALNRFTCRWTDQVLAVSPAVKDILIERDRVPADKIVVLGNGVDLDSIDATDCAALGADPGIPSGATVIVSVGRMVPDKGHIFLLHAFAKVASSFPASCLLLVGDGPERERLQANARLLGVEDRVYFSGFRRDVIAILKSSDIFVLPSLEEGFPVALLEAMACRLPVIASDIGGVRPLVIANDTGLLVPPAEAWVDGDISVMSNAEQASSASLESHSLAVVGITETLTKLLGDKVERARLAASGREHVEKNWSLAGIVDKLEAIYRSHLGASSTPVDSVGTDTGASTGANLCAADTTGSWRQKSPAEVAAKAAAN